VEIAKCTLLHFFLPHNFLKSQNFESMIVFFFFCKILFFHNKFFFMQWFGMLEAQVQVGRGFLLSVEPNNCHFSSFSKFHSS
jgi:hypothetical protein